MYKRRDIPMSTRDFLIKSNVIETEMFQRYPEELEQLLSAANVLPGVGGSDINFEKYLRLNEIIRKEYYQEADDGYGGVDTMETIVDERDLLDIAEDRLLLILASKPDLVNSNNFAGLRFSIYKDYTRAVEYILTSPNLRPNENLPLILNSTKFGEDLNHEYLYDPVSNSMKLTLYLFGQKYGATLSEGKLKLLIRMPVQEFIMVLRDYKKYFLNQIHLENQSAEDTSRIKDYLLMSDPLYSTLLNSKLQYAYDMYTFFKEHRPDRVESMKQEKENLDFLIKEGADYNSIEKHGGYGFA